MNMNKEERFKQIISNHEALIHGICRHYNSNEEDRKDMYQEILVNIWKSIDNFRGDSKLSTWIYRVAVNTSLSFNNKSFRNARLMVYEDDRHLNKLFDENELKEKQKLETDLEQLEIQINLLSVIDKALISLLLEGLSTREIAEIIGLTEPNVRVKIHRIKDQLKNSFKKKEKQEQNEIFNSSQRK